MTVSAFCQTIAITVDGTPQPLLWDTSGGLGTMANDLLGADRAAGSAIAHVPTRTQIHLFCRLQAVVSANAATAHVA